MRKFICFVATYIVVTACTIDKTDYESETNTVVPDKEEFQEVFAFQKGSYQISVEALGGKLYKGYNEIHLRMVDNDSKQVVDGGKMTFLPVQTSTDGQKTSCPTSYELTYESQEKYYTGYSVFTEESKKGKWEVVIDITIDQQSFSHTQSIEVLHQSNMNLNMTSFVGNDQVSYILALVSPSKPKVAENELTACIFKFNPSVIAEGEEVTALRNAYTVVDHFTLFLDPRMPEPSMGNHSSPNNRDLVQGSDRFYHGVVNYTMTGNWTLNFILQNNQGRIVKGTKVPTDFTPGVAGVKSELFIDILF